MAGINTLIFLRVLTDLADAEWDIVRAFIPEPVKFPNLEEPKYSRRDVMPDFDTCAGPTWSKCVISLAFVRAEAKV